ncbi:MAG: glycosyl hydrolase [Lentisphaerota bacterium]
MSRIQRYPLFSILLLLFLFAHMGSALAAAAKPPVPASGAYLGAILLEGQTSLSRMNEDTGIRHAVFMEFLEFPRVLDANDVERAKITAFIETCRQAGAMPALTLEVPGGLDAYSIQQVEQFADFLNSFDFPMFLRWCHEMNGSWYKWGQKPTLYKAKFREFADIIHQRAPGVAMVWTPNQGWGYGWTQGSYAIQPGNPDFSVLDTNGDGQLTEADDPYGPYYPGDEYVDWVGHSFYHWGNDRGLNQIPWTGKWGQANGVGHAVPNFHNLFAVGHNKPMLIAETSAFYNPGDSSGASETDLKSAWIQQVYNLANSAQPRLNVDFPQIKAIFWFSQMKYEAEVQGTVDWRLNSNPSVIAAYRQVATNAYFIPAIFEGDNLEMGDTPAIIEPNQTYAIDVSYSASAPRDIVLSLLNPANNYAWHGGGRITVAAGQGTAAFNVKVENDPASGDTYIWDVILVPEGGNWQQAIDHDQRPVSVVADELAFVSVPAALRPGEVATLAFDYLANPASEAKQLRVSLLDTDNQWAWYGSSMVDLPVGSGTIEVPFLIEGAPAAGNHYVLDAHIARVSDDWSKATAQAQVEAMVGEALEIVGAPLSVQNNLSYDLTFSYVCSQARYLNINLLRPASGYAWYGGNAVQVGPGSGQVTVQVQVQGNPPAAQDYLWDAYLSTQAGDWQNPTAGDQIVPIAVARDGLVITASPQVFQSGQAYAITLDYFQNAMEGGKYVRVDLLDPNNNWTWHGGSLVLLPVDQASGQVTVNLDVQNDPAPGDHYVLSAFIAPNGSDWSLATASAVQNAAVGTDSLSIAAAPLAVAPNQTVSVTVNYSAQAAVEGKYLAVNLLRPGQNFAWFGGTNIALAPGAGQATVQFKVQGGTISGTDYAIDAFIARNGLDWSAATAHAQAQTALQVDTISFQSYPSSIYTPRTWTVKVNYNVWGPRKIRVDLLTPAPDYVWREGNEVVVPAGSGVATVNIAVPATFPSGSHVWAVYCAPAGGSYETRTAEVVSPPFWVQRDPVSIISAPTQVRPGQTYDVTLWWEVFENSDAHIDLVRDAVFTWHGGTWTNIGTGTGTRTFQVTVNPGTPAGSDFLWSSWVGPAGQGYAQRSADNLAAPITVLAP